MVNAYTYDSNRYVNLSVEICTCITFSSWFYIFFLFIFLYAFALTRRWGLFSSIFGVTHQYEHIIFYEIFLFSLATDFRTFIVPRNSNFSHQLWIITLHNCVI